MDKSKVESLLVRVEQSQGPDRQIDWDIYEALTGEVPDFHGCQRYTEITDAALALVERMLPEYGVQVGHPIKKLRDYGWYASVFRERRAGDKGWWPGHYNGGRDDEGEHLRYYPSGALAILAALLTALSQQEKP